MGKKAKVILCDPAMIAVLLVGLLMPLFHGCTVERSAPPPPQMRVERTDTSQMTGVIVYYDHHFQEGSSGYHTFYLSLNTPEEVAAYLEEVEFLLTRLEEAQQRMNIHEPELEEIVQGIEGSQ